MENFRQRSSHVYDINWAHKRIFTSKDWVKLKYDCAECLEEVQYTCHGCCHNVMHPQGHQAVCMYNTKLGDWFPDRHYKNIVLVNFNLAVQYRFTT